MCDNTPRISLKRLVSDNETLVHISAGKESLWLIYGALKYLAAIDEFGLEDADQIRFGIIDDSEMDNYSEDDNTSLQDHAEIAKETSESLRIGLDKL